MSRVIGQREVRRAAADGTPITIGSAQVVTPAARDLARELGVALKHEDAGPGTDAGTVAMGSDHGGFEMKENLKPIVRECGWEIIDVGPGSADPVDYPVFAARVADLVAAGSATYGIMVDGAGIGSAMVCNKVKGVRAALCYDTLTAHNAREHNNANVLTLGGTLIGRTAAAAIVKTFLRTPFGGGRHARRVAMIDALDTPG